MTTEKRKEALNKIIKKAQLDKTAEEVVDSVDTNAADDEDFGHKIFEELLKNIKIEGFEDLD